MKGSRANIATNKATAPRNQKFRSRQSWCLVNSIAEYSANGINMKLNQVMAVRPFIKKAKPSHAARLFVRSRTNSTSASKTSGIQGENKKETRAIMLYR